MLVVKVIGWTNQQGSWTLSCAFHPAKPVGRSGLLVTAPKATGYFRGAEARPKAEIEFYLVNTTDVDFAGIPFRVTLDGQQPAATGTVEVVGRRDITRVVCGLEVGAGGTAGGRISVGIRAGSARGSASRRLTNPRHPPWLDSAVYLGVGFHCDPVYKYSQAMHTEVAFHNVTQYLDFCRADPGFRFILHELDYLKPYMDCVPENRDYLIGLVRAGRVILAGSYNEPSEKNISGEQIIRNILYGKLFARSQFGVDPKVYHPWDVFGHIPQLPQILAKSGMIGAVWCKTIEGFPPLFRHMSLDGTTVPCRMVPMDFPANSFEQFRERAYDGLDEMVSMGHPFDLRMDCQDFKPPSPWMLGRSDELSTLLPRIEIADPARFFERLLDNERSGRPLPVVSGDATQYHIGTSLSRVELKIANRLIESALYSAELLSTFASVLGRPYPDIILDKAWRQILFNSHHDGITGTCSDISYLDMLQGYREALALAKLIVKESLSFIAANIDTTGTACIPLIVFNALNWERTDVVRAWVRFPRPVPSFSLTDMKGDRIPFSVLESEATDQGTLAARIEFVAHGIPSCGYSVYGVSPMEEGTLPQWESLTDADCIENEFLRIKVDRSRGGGICSFIDKQSGKEIVREDGDHLANEIAVLKEKGDRPDPSWEFHTTGEKTFSRDYPVDVTVQKSGPTMRILVRGRLGETCDLVREIWLRRGMRRVDLRTEIRHYSGQDDLLAVLFPIQVEGAGLTFEERFGAIVKSPGRSALDYRTWAGHAYSGCAIHSSQNFFDYGSTTKMRFVDGQGRTAASVPLGLVGLILPPKYGAVENIAADLQKGLANRGILTTPIPGDEARNMGLGNASFTISLGYAGNNPYSSSVLRRAEEAVREYLADQIRHKGFGLVVVKDNAPYVGDNAPVLVVEARNPSALEEAVGFLLQGLESGDLVLPEHSNRLGDNSVEDYGVSVLNNGNMANTVEPDGTMTLLLEHTSDWVRKHLGQRFVPEQTDRVFFYAVYPHAASWREAQSYRRGWEYNIPLISIQVDRHKGRLPPRHSFLTISSSNVVLSACRPKDNPVATFESFEPGAGGGVMLRLYEAEGKATEMEVKLSCEISEIWKTNLLGERLGQVDRVGNSFSDCIGPFAVETYEVKPSGVLPTVHIGEAAAEVMQPTYSKYWRHNLGAAPWRFQPVAVSLQGSAVSEVNGYPAELNRISASVVNNYADRSISGNAFIDAPAGWTVTPRTLRYEVAPGKHASYPVTFGFSRLRKRGLLQVRLTHEGQILEDAMEIGSSSRHLYQGKDVEPPLGPDVNDDPGIVWSASAEDDVLTVRVENRYYEPVGGTIAMISPLESWSEEEVGDYSLLELEPAVRGFHIAGRSSCALQFALVRRTACEASLWAYAKLICNGRAEYKKAL